jgi:hypothetical protein
MADTIMNNDNELSVSPSNWRGIYRIGAIAALAILPFGIMDILITFLPGGATPDPGEGTVKDWIGLFQRDSLLALRGLGLLNIFTLVLGVPVFYALYAAHRRLSKPIALFALMLFLMGAAIYIARNPAFPMQTLAQNIPWQPLTISVHCSQRQGRPFWREARILPVVHLWGSSLSILQEYSCRQ